MAGTCKAETFTFNVGEIETLNYPQNILLQGKIMAKVILYKAA